MLFLFFFSQFFFFPFGKRRYLAEEDPAPEYEAFMDEQGTARFVHKLKGNKEPFDFIPKSVIATALVTVLGKMTPSFASDVRGNSQTSLATRLV